MSRRVHIDYLIQFRIIIDFLLITTFFILCILFESFPCKLCNLKFCGPFLFPMIDNFIELIDNELLELTIVHVLSFAHLLFDQLFPFMREHIFPSIRLSLLDVLPENGIRLVNIFRSHILEICVTANFAILFFLAAHISE